MQPDDSAAEQIQEPSPNPHTILVVERTHNRCRACEENILGNYWANPEFLAGNLTPYEL